MAITSSKVACTTTAQVIVNIDDVTQYVSLHSKGAVYIGPLGVTSSNGFLIDNGDKLTITVPAASSLYAIMATGSADLYVLTTRVD